jgi:hypothetical protein
MHPSSRTARRALGLVMLAALAALGVVALAACGGDEKKAKARPLPEEPKALRPGTYRSEEFKPSLSFHVGKGWSSSPLGEASDILEITRGQTTGVNFSNAQEVYKPTKTGSANVVDAPKDMVGWLQQHPYLQTSKPEPVTVGGVKGLQFDVVLGDLPQTYSGTCTTIVGQPNCVDLVRLSTGGSLFAAEGYPVRVIVLEDLEGETVTIGFFSPASEFEEFVPEAQKVIDTVKWGGS